MKTRSPGNADAPTPESQAEPRPHSEKGQADGKTAINELKIKRILVPIDFSDCSLRALDYAVTFASEFEAKVILLHVVEPAIYPENYALMPPVLDETNQNLVQAARERLEALGRKRVGHRLAVETLVRIGRAYSEIPDTARALGADLIIIGTHGYTGLKHVLLGSTAERVVRHGPCPVLTVRHSGPTTAEHAAA